MDDAGLALVAFEPCGRRGRVPRGTTVMEAARLLGADLLNVCGGQGTCGKCAVRPLGMGGLGGSDAPALSAPSETERELFAGHAAAEPWRLACEARVLGHVVVHVPERARAGRQVIRKAVTGPLRCPVDPAVPLPAGCGPRTAFGVALDVGSTTIACYLCDLVTGAVVESAAMINPQVAYGEDVMARITFAIGRAGGGAILHAAVVGALNQLIADVAAAAGITSHDVRDIVIVGNTCMHHLVLGLDVEPLSYPPFSPVVREATDVPACDLGIDVPPGVNLHALPTVAGFVGADTLGVLIGAEPFADVQQATLVIDIGTNGELVLGKSGRLVCSSCATGPALEGAGMKFGMRAAPGAIERVRIDPGTLTVRCKRVGDEGWWAADEGGEAAGLCGSGVFDAVAEACRRGIIQRNGRFDLAVGRRALRDGPDGPELVLARSSGSQTSSVVLTQDDVRSFQLAKGAMCSAARLMMRHLGVEQLDRVVLAGAFGSVIDPASAAAVGLYPECHLDHVVAVGNAAGDGARAALLSRARREEAQRLARQMEHLELTRLPSFARELARAMFLPGGPGPEGS